LPYTYQNLLTLWKFDEVLTEPKMHSIFETQCIYQDPELSPWGNTSSSAITRSHRRVHRPLHISWQWYPLVWAFHPKDTQAHRSSFKYFRQTGQCLEADRIEFTDEDTALQCPCHLHTVIWLWDI